jgi:outer membrane protein TolC
VRQTRWTIEQIDQSVRLQRNQLYPQVDAFGSYGYIGSGQEYSDVFNQIGNRENPTWSFGGQLSIPLGRTGARNAYKTAKAQREQSLLQLKQFEQKTVIQIENDIANARSDFERVSATREARLYAEAALDAEQKKLENGKSTSFVVLQLQRDLTTARSAEILALVNYNVSLAVLAFDEGTTLDRRRIYLQIVK